MKGTKISILVTSLFNNRTRNGSATRTAGVAHAEEVGSAQEAAHVGMPSRTLANGLAEQMAQTSSISKKVLWSANHGGSNPPSFRVVRGIRVRLHA